jgi:GDP-4-dehydro-6-deoxy-D-mannose reductase
LDRRVLITGGTGFVGSHLLQLLKLQAVTVAVAAPEASKSSGQVGVRYYDLDLRCNDDLRALVRDFPATEIYHLAGISDVESSWSNPRLTFEVNVAGTCNLLEAAMQLPSPPRILNVSTSQVYAASSRPLKETDPLDPRNPYAASKAMSELLAVPFRKSGVGGVITVRAFNHTGPGQSSKFALPAFAEQFAEAEQGLRAPELLVGNLDVSRDISDVRDVVAAYVSLIENGKVGEVYNVCSGAPCRLADAIEEMKKLSSMRIGVKTDPARVRSNEVPVVWGDAGKLQRQTGWRPRIQLKETISDLMRYWRERVQLQSRSQSPVNAF